MLDFVVFMEKSAGLPFGLQLTYSKLFLLGFIFKLCWTKFIAIFCLGLVWLTAELLSKDHRGQGFPLWLL
jgi:hypothetical protein